MGWPCCASEEEKKSTFHYDFRNIFDAVLGWWDDVPVKAWDQADILMKLIKHLAGCETSDEFITKVYDLKSKMERANALNQEPLDEFGKAMKNMDPQKKEIDNPAAPEESPKKEDEEMEEEKEEDDDLFSD